MSLMIHEGAKKLRPLAQAFAGPSVREKTESSAVVHGRGRFDGNISCHHFAAVLWPGSTRIDLTLGISGTVIDQRLNSRWTPLWCLSHKIDFFSSLGVTRNPFGKGQALSLA